MVQQEKRSRMKSEKSEQRNVINRRWFLKKAGGCLGTLSLTAGRVFASGKAASPNDKLNIAGVGIGYRGYSNLVKCANENIVALCDVDWNLAAPAAERFPHAKVYTDYRRMLDKEKDIDAVMVATPDHTHAVITAAAMRHGCHVYTEMPLAHNVREARKLTEIAGETGVVTQMGNQSHSHYVARRTCEWVWSGKLGAVRKVECWTSRPTWPQGMDGPPKSCPPPETLDWNLWTGPAVMKPFSAAYHPRNWKGWRNFGTGALGYAGCYVMDPAFWALKLGEAQHFTVEADSSGINAWSYPSSSTVRYSFPARGDMPPLSLIWYDGGRKPPLPEKWPENRQHTSHGSIIHGEENTLVVDQVLPGYDCVHLVPGSLMYTVENPPKKLPRVKHGPRYNPTRHQQEWVRGCKAGKQPCSNFEYAGPLSEMALLGNVALAAGIPIEWDRKAMKITNDKKANNLLQREYRKGWKL